MIISHQHKYLFVELEHTGSTAISQELCANYAGAPILHKHAFYHEFQKIASAEEKKYFVFASVRNPLDEAVSLYFKCKNNHKNNFTNPAMRKKNGGHISDDDLQRFRFIRDAGADFPVYFKKFYTMPYDNFSSLAHKKFDFILRFENIQDDFAQVLKMMGIEQTRPLPATNKTAGKENHFLSFYTPDIRDQAKRVFGPFMQKWDYEFPPEWGDNSIPWSDQVQFQAISTLKRLHWRHPELGSLVPVFKKLWGRFS